MTAVEFLIDWMEKNQYFIGNDLLQIVEKSKEMEKQQIMNATYYGHLKGWVDDGVENSHGEQYYNETFKNTKE